MSRQTITITLSRNGSIFLHISQENSNFNFFNDWSFKPSEFDKSWVEISEMIDASNLSYKGCNKRCAKMGLPSAVLKRNKFGKKLN